MIKLKFDNFIGIILIFAGFLLPNAILFNNLLELPSVVNILFGFIGLGIVIVYTYKKRLNLSNIDKISMGLFILFYLWIIISVIANLADVPTMHPYHDRARGINAPGIRSVYYGAFRPLIFVIFSILLYLFVDNYKNIKSLIWGMFGLGIACSFYGIYQFIGYKLGWPATAIFSGHDGHDITLMGLRRIEGLFYEPGPHATFLAPLLVIFVFQLLKPDSKIALFNKPLTIFVVVLFSIILPLTFSPIAYISPFIAVGVFFILNLKLIFSKKKAIIYFSTFIIISTIFIFVSYGAIFSNKSQSNSLVSIKNYIVKKVLYQSFITDDPMILANPDERATRNLAGYNMFKKHPIFGVGVGNAIFHFYANIPKFDKSVHKIVDVNSNGVINVYFNILAETGIVGLLLFLLFLYYPVFLYIKNIKHIENSENKIPVQAILTAYIVFLAVPMHTYLCFWSPTFWIYNILLIRIITITINEQKQLLLAKQETL